ncbi:MAG: glycosyltransferase [Pontiella sp.]
MFNFVANSSTGDDLSSLRNLSWDEGIVACTRHTWVWALYCQLKMRGVNVSINYEPVDGAVNIIHGQIARSLLKPADFRRYFIIGIRADFRPFPYGQYEVVQNIKSEGGNCVYMPLYPQPGLIARSPEREGVSNICFSGRIQNTFDVEHLKKDLQGMECRFVFKGEGEWQDMSDVDVLLGIRSLSTNSYDSKPSTKLLNAWHAGIPFIGGYDSGFEHIGSPGINYLRVKTYDELIDAIRRLKEDRGLYQQLIDEGRKAGQAYTPERITDRWMEFLDGPVAESFANWSNKKSGFDIKRLGLEIRFMRESGLLHLQTFRHLVKWP